LVLRAAEETDGRTERVSDAVLTYVVAHDRAFILDRASLRNVHLAPSAGAGRLERRLGEELAGAGGPDR
jgi:hypothetical protein